MLKKNNVISKVFKKEYIQVLLVMLIVQFFFIFDILKQIPLHTSTDELGAMIGPAYLAGRDWSGVVSYSGYYGFGFFSLFFWLFKITSNPILIHRVLLIGCSILRVMQIPIAYYIGKKYLGIRNRHICILMAALMPFLHTSRVSGISNEYVVELVIWLDLLLVLKIVEYHEQTNSLIISIVLWISLMIYAQTIHTRLLVLLISNLIVMAILCIKSKKRLFLICGCVVALLSHRFIKNLLQVYQENIWGVQENLRNASVEISTTIDIFSKKTWVVLVHMLLGMFDTMVLVFAGIFLIAVVAFLYYMFNRIKEIRKFLGFQYVDVLLLITILCMGATILAFLLSGWMEGILQGWDTGGTEQEFIYSFKGLTYIRYWEPYVGPFCLGSLSIVLFDKVFIKKLVSIAVGIYVLLQCLFINLILPFIENNVHAIGPFNGISMFKLNEPVTRNNYLVTILIATGIFLLCVLFLKIEKHMFSIILFVLMLAAQYKYGIYQCDLPIQKEMSTLINASYNKIQELERNGEKIHKIYVYDDREDVDNNWKIFSIAQFYLNEYTLIEGKPEKLGKNEIIIATEEIEQFGEYLSYQLDDNEIWYYKE